MCLNVNAMSAMSTASSMFANRSMARQGSAQANSYADAAIQDYGSIAARSRESIKATTDKIGQRANQATREIGRINAVLSDSNLAGSSSARLRREVEMNRDTDVATMNESASNELSQAKRDMRGVGNQHASRANSIKKPSAIESGLTAAAANIGAKGPTIKDLWSKR